MHCRILVPSVLLGINFPLLSCFPLFLVVAFPILCHIFQFCHIFHFCNISHFFFIFPTFFFLGGGGGGHIPDLWDYDSTFIYKVSGRPYLYFLGQLIGKYQQGTVPTLWYVYMSLQSQIFPKMFCDWSIYM